MKILSTLIAKQVAENVQRCHSFCQMILSSFGRLLHRMATSTQSIVLLISLLFLSLLTAPAKPAYAQQTQNSTLTPQEVVAFALTLEKLEADFYCRALSEIRSGRLGDVPSVVRNVIISYGEDEAIHVADLTDVLRKLGGNPDTVTIPANPNYNAILNRNPFANVADLLLALQRVEDLGVAAYKGQAPNLLAAKNAKTILAGALEIHSVEARHAAGIRYLRQILFEPGVRPWIRDPQSVIYNEVRSGFPIPFASAAFDGFATREEVLKLVSPILSAR